MSTQPPPVTNDELIKHRLRELEEFATGWREAERRVDTLVMTVGSLERTVTEIQTEMRGNNERITGTLARLHERLDEAMTEKAREEGREEGRAQARALLEHEMRESGRRLGLEEARRTTWKVVAATAPIAIAFTVMVFIVLNFALN